MWICWYTGDVAWRNVVNTCGHKCCLYRGQKAQNEHFKVTKDDCHSKDQPFEL